ncbi:MAG: peptidoglycan bridge formation glycyltransferase FemA/FemB family protein, partial [Anaerolineae bacterium]|nr:peptidoglycan bridge formation glycyltransferase FemA/FemB family protein [Anaerolineae bacterium]
PRTIVLDIGDAAEDDILARMKQKTRYNIRLSGRKEVSVREGTRADVVSFNALLRVTGERDTFGVHAPAYYELAYDLFVPSGRAALLLASHAGIDLAGVMVFALGQTAWYFYGASSNEERQRMPTYAVQWAAIQWARVQGCTVYDLWGVPDTNEESLEADFTDRTDGLWSVYRFKRGFGGELVRRLPAYDYVYNAPLYAAYQGFLRLRARGESGDS